MTSLSHSIISKPKININIWIQSIKSNHAKDIKQNEYIRLVCTGGCALERAEQFLSEPNNDRLH